MVRHSTRPTDLVRRWVVFAAIVGMITFNGISQAIPLGGETIGDVSARYPTFFTPASYAFSIWTVIYFLLLLFGISQVVTSRRDDESFDRIWWLVVVSCVLNCLWIVVFQFDEILLSSVVIVALLLTLLAIYRRLDIGGRQVSTADRWLVQLPFSVYLAWISVATVANITLLGVALNWGGLFGIAAPVWAAIMIVVVATIGLLVLSTRGDIAFVLVLIWAFVAIAVRQFQTSVVADTALIAAAALVIALVVSVAQPSAAS